MVRLMRSRMGSIVAGPLVLDQGDVQPVGGATEAGDTFVTFTVPATICNPNSHASIRENRTVDASGRILSGQTVGAFSSSFP